MKEGSISMSQARLCGGGVVLGANPPILNFNSGLVNEAGLAQTIVPGVNTVPLVATGGIAPAQGAFFANPTGPLVASGMQSIGIDPFTDTTKLISMLQEGAAGAVSAFADYEAQFVWLSSFGLQTSELISIGSIAFDGGGIPSFVVNDGMWASITDNGVGNISPIPTAGFGLERRAQMIMTARGTLAASQLRSLAATQNTPAKQVTLLQEGAAGAASALTDYAFDFAIFGPRRAPTSRATPRVRQRQMRVHALASVTIAGGIASFVFQDGAFASVVRTAPGVVDLTLQPGMGVAATESVAICFPSVPATASNMRSNAVAQTSATVKTVTMLQEGAAGAASALTDNDFVVAIFKLFAR
jgi:hypothetical protein